MGISGSMFSTSLAKYYIYAFPFIKQINNLDILHLNKNTLYNSYKFKIILDTFAWATSLILNFSAINYFSFMVE